MDDNEYYAQQHHDAKRAELAKLRDENKRLRDELALWNAVKTTGTFNIIVQLRAEVADLKTDLREREFDSVVREKQAHEHTRRKLNQVLSELTPPAESD